MTTEIAQLTTPVGAFRASIEDGVIRTASFVPPGAGPDLRDGAGVHDALRAYFDGDVAALDVLTVDGEGTAFQRSVWKCLRAIPPGETRSYGELAAAVGMPTAARAVGMANATNPIALIVPCHRVIRTGGAIGGYAFGIEVKRWLLDHEWRATHDGEAPGEAWAGAPDAVTGQPQLRLPVSL